MKSITSLRFALASALLLCVSPESPWKYPMGLFLHPFWAHEVGFDNRCRIKWFQRLCVFTIHHFVVLYKLSQITCFVFHTNVLPTSTTRAGLVKCRGICTRSLQWLNQGPLLRAPPKSIQSQKGAYARPIFYLLHCIVPNFAGNSCAR